MKYLQNTFSAEGLRGDKGMLSYSLQYAFRKTRL